MCQDLDAHSPRTIECSKLFMFPRRRQWNIRYRRLVWQVTVCSVHPGLMMECSMIMAAVGSVFCVSPTFRIEGVGLHKTSEIFQKKTKHVCTFFDHVSSSLISVCHCQKKSVKSTNLMKPHTNKEQLLPFLTRKIQFCRSMNNPFQTPLSSETQPKTNSHILSWNISEHMSHKPHAPSRSSALLQGLFVEGVAVE